MGDKDAIRLQWTENKLKKTEGEREHALARLAAAEKMIAQVCGAA